MSREGAGAGSARGARGLLGWLRRDARAPSLDSLSSAGSDRTTASFAFLPPHHYRFTATPAPIALSRPTDSYNKRLQDINVRKQYDEGITLRRKYGLYRDPGDTFSLPAACKSTLGAGLQESRGRRATSEGQRCSAHVPGKRRAPPPPAACTLPRRRTRKRPAPPPPIKEEDKENYEVVAVTMNSKKSSDKKIVNRETNSVPKEKSSAKELKHERSFLRNIFDSKKKTLTCAPTKYLPNISELDKQAAEIIEKKRASKINCGLDENEESEYEYIPMKIETWFCSKCLRKYNNVLDICMYCKKKRPESMISTISDDYTQTENKPSTSSASKDTTEKQKLKEMLKEIKDSLPKKCHNYEYIDLKGNSKVTAALETPTLPIGFSMSNQANQNFGPSTSKGPNTKTEINITDYSNKKGELSNTVIITQVVPINDSKIVKNADFELKKLVESKNNLLKATDPSTSSKLKDLQTPLKISSLLNPLYVPNKELPCRPVVTSTNKIDKKSNQNTENNAETEVVVNIAPITNVQNDPSTNSGTKTGASFKEDEKPKNDNRVINQTTTELRSSNVPITKLETSSAVVLQKSTPIAEIKITNDIRLNNSSTDQPGPSNVPDDKIEKLEVQKSSEVTISQVSSKYSEDKSTMSNIDIKKKELIKLLEVSIANGDEQKASQAAIELAQLRLPCSLAIPEALNTKINETNECREETTTKIIRKDNDLKSDQTNVNKNNINFTDSGATSPAMITNVKAKKDSSTNTQLNVQKSETGVNAEARTTNIETNINEPSTSQPSGDGDIVSIEVWIEDKRGARGPLRVDVARGATLGELRARAAAALGLRPRLQRWVVERALCADPAARLAALAGPGLRAPFYLCLVDDRGDIDETDKASPVEAPKENPLPNRTSAVYSELMELEQQALVPNTEPFECDVCMEECGAGAGAVLKECVHAFCRACLREAVRHCADAAVPCPAAGCAAALQEREVRALVAPPEYERWLARGLAAAESSARGAFHCRTRDCAGWALCEPGARRFPCPVCGRTNCLVCKAIHEGQTCTEHKAKLQEAVKTAETANTAQVDDEGTRALIESMISRGEALGCPECSAIITKKWGCDWVKCSACKTEICWVTRGRRWGPAGRGDTSAGCRCGVDGKRCHPSCAYCH